MAPIDREQLKYDLKLIAICFTVVEAFLALALDYFKLPFWWLLVPIIMGILWIIYAYRDAKKSAESQKQFWDEMGRVYQEFHPNGPFKNW